VGPAVRLVREVHAELVIDRSLLLRTGAGECGDGVPELADDG
jgi:hypothetical protein